MNKLILLLILVVMVSCKDEKKANPEKEIKETPKKELVVVKSFTTHELGTWTKTRVDLEPADKSETVFDAYHLSRNTTKESAFLSSSIIPVNYGSEYKVTVNAKKGKVGSFLGLRMSGTYPDRVDAIFDLDKGVVLDYKTSRDFENPLVSIENLGNGWYQCSLTAEVAADNIRVLMGATEANKNVLGWEGKTEKAVDILFVPSRVVVEEVIIN